MFKIVVLLIAVVNGQPQQALMKSHQEFADKAACDVALNGDAKTPASVKKLVADLAAQNITAHPVKAECINVKDLPDEGTPA